MILTFLGLIPTVPMSLKHGLCSTNFKVETTKYVVTYETDEWYVFLEENTDLSSIQKQKDDVYVFNICSNPIRKKMFCTGWKFGTMRDNRKWEIMFLSRRNLT